MDLEGRIKLLEQMMNKVEKELGLREMSLSGLANPRVEGEAVDTRSLKEKVRIALELIVGMKDIVTDMVTLFYLTIGFSIVAIVGLLFMLYRVW